MEITFLDRVNKNSDFDGASATQVVIEKLFPQDYAGAGICGEFYISLRDSNYHFAVHSADVTFGLSKTVDGLTDNDIDVFTQLSDCSGGAAASPISSITIPVGQNSVRVFYKFPSDPSLFNKVFEFSVIHPTTLAASTNAASVTLRNPAEKFRFLEIQSPNYRLYKDLCTPFNLSIYSYSGSLASSDAFERKVTLSSPNSSVKFYPDSSCASEINFITFASGSASSPIFVKYIPAGSESFEIVDFTFQLVGSAASDPLLTFDSPDTYWSADVSSKSIPTRADIHTGGNPGIARDVCYPMNYTLVNANHTPIPINTVLNVDLAFKEIGVGQFFSSNDCSGTPIINTPTPASSGNQPANGLVYFKILATAPAGEFHVMWRVNGALSESRGIYLSPIPSP